MTLIAPDNVAIAGYTASATVANWAGPPKGITIKGEISWAAGDAIVNYVEADILDSVTGMSAKTVPSLSFTYDGANRKLTLSGENVPLGSGTYTVHLYWYHNEGGDVVKESDSVEITVEPDPGEGN